MDPSFALQARFEEDEAAFRLSLSSPSAEESLPKGRAYAERLLLEATPTAIRTLKRVAESGDDKAAVSAASKILDKSPATRDALSTVGTFSLPAEALHPLISALASFAQAALSPLVRSPESLTILQAEDPITMEVSNDL